ncbi:hypothetical protein PUR71_32010 [Streptomyces sp. SP17BM10]|uniref:hypothetical protein n=1 Tax=Streptomyces sp. SP17BM10 TaxID=3002530 RepID=UPI002E79D630|nr:hypothetical protein [Streptomyces sp. SP17BM10]MEE1787495.1 hypothetical protein [Streptomyces sp. SP17BM10]
MAEAAAAGDRSDGCGCGCGCGRGFGFGCDCGSGGDEPRHPVAGMTISVRTRRDVVVVDPERFLVAARAAFRELYPGAGEEDARRHVRDVTDAVDVLLERDGVLAPGLRDAGAGGCGPLPGRRVLDRPDGLSPAGEIQRIVLDDPKPLQDVLLFQLAEDRDLFALPPTE